MARWRRELKELVLLLRVAEPDSYNLGVHVAARADALAPLLGVTPPRLRELALRPDQEVAPYLRARVDVLARVAEEEDRSQRCARAACAAQVLGRTARWTAHGAVLDVEVLLRDALADRSKKYIAFNHPSLHVPVRRETLARVAPLRRVHLDVTAYVDPRGLHFRWKAGRGGYNWRPVTVPAGDADRVLTIRLRTERREPGAWLGEILGALDYSA